MQRFLVRKCRLSLGHFVDGRSRGDFGYKSTATPKRLLQNVRPFGRLALHNFAD